MKKLKLLEFKSAAKSEVEAWLTIENNFSSVISSLQRLLTIVGKGRGQEIEHRDKSLVVPLYVYAVTWYLRCFATGRRARLSIEEIPGLSETDRKTHEQIRILRNHHFAHAVTNKHEGTYVHLIVSDDKGKALGFKWFYVTLASDSRQDLQRFLRLAQKVLAHARVRTRVVADPFARSFFGAEASWDSTQWRIKKKQSGSARHGSNRRRKASLGKRPSSVA